MPHGEHDGAVYFGSRDAEVGGRPPAGPSATIAAPGCAQPPAPLGWTLDFWTLDFWTNVARSLDCWSRLGSWTYIM